MNFYVKWVVFLLILFLSFSGLFGLSSAQSGIPPALAASQSAWLEIPLVGKEDGESGQIVWKLTGLGRLSADILADPNGNLYLVVGNKLLVVNTTNGHLLWEAHAPAGGKPGQPVFAGNGTIFLPGPTAIQEIKPNGATGWSFNVYQGSKGGGPGNTKASLLTRGPNDLLYLFLPAGLYAVDAQGHYHWSLSQWDAGDRYTTRLDRDREILACAGNLQAVFVAYGKKQEGYQLAAINEKGDIFWRWWLGKIKDCYLFTNAAGKNGDVVVGEDLLIAIVNPAKVDRLNKGRVYAFRSNSSLSAGKKGIKENYLNNQLLWTYSLPFNDLSAPALAADKTLYFCAGKRLYALNVVNGEEKWTLPLLNVVSPPVVEKASRRIYASSSDDRFFAVNSAGRMIWERILDGPIKHAPLADPDGYLYVATDRGTLYKIKG